MVKLLRCSRWLDGPTLAVAEEAAVPVGTTVEAAGSPMRALIGSDSLRAERKFRLLPTESTEGRESGFI